MDILPYNSLQEGRLYRLSPSPMGKIGVWTTTHAFGGPGFVGIRSMNGVSFVSRAGCPLAPKALVDLGVDLPPEIPLDVRALRLKDQISGRFVQVTYSGRVVFSDTGDEVDPDSCHIRNSYEVELEAWLKTQQDKYSEW